MTDLLKDNQYNPPSDKYEVRVKVYLTGDSDDALKMAQALVDYAHDRPHVNNITVSIQKVA